MHNAFEGTAEDPDDNTVTTITPITNVVATAATTADTLGTAQPSRLSTVNAEIAAAINQLLANQTVIMTQMAALSFMPAPANPTRGRTIANVPPIQQLAVLFQQRFPAGEFSAGRGGRRGGGCGRGHGGRGHTPFADYL